MTKNILRSVYPRMCPGCREVLPPDLTVCPKCERKFTKIYPPCCFKCGRHIQNEEELICSECAKKSHHYDRGFAVFRYDSFMRQAMSDFKFNGMRENCLFFIKQTVELQGGAILDYSPDVIVPVPVHRSKLAFRGYNQAEVLARELSLQLGIPTVTDLLVRTRRTDASKKLNSRQRRVNLDRAFICNTQKYTDNFVKSKFKKVLLMDDIYTTGSTMDRCTLALKDAGVSEVGILSISIGSVL